MRRACDLHLGRFAAAALLGLLALLPLWWAAASALRPTDEIFRYLSPLSFWTLLPAQPTLANVTALWSSNFPLALVNSAFVTAATVVVGLALCASAAFALAAIEFPGRGIVFSVMVVSFLIPFDAIAVPLFGVLRDVHLQNSYLGLILPGIGNGLAVFLLRQFFIGIPGELKEAAMIDGLGWLGIFWRIYLPLSRPALVGAGLILFVFQWQAYLWPLLIAPAPDYKVAAVAIADFAGQFDVDYGQMFAGTLCVALVPMIVLLVLQRYFTASVASSGSRD